MPTEPSTNFCPYRGLQPFTEEDRAYFFGREHDTEIIIANLYAAALTVLYGASGAGKSSVLLAGVVPGLKRAPRVGIVVTRKWQDERFYASLKDEIRAAANSATGLFQSAADAPLDDLLADAAAALRGRIFLIFDQFEEYFLYHAASAQTQQFEAELARAVNRQDVAANFLFSMRDDGLSRLDRFEGRIPNLLSNMLRLEHLDRSGARDAVCRPLEVFGRQWRESRLPNAIEESLVDALLQEARPGTFEAATESTVSGTAEGHVTESDSDRIETPLLQMVLFRLWKEESGELSRVMRLSTFERVGRARGIAHTHVDDAMGLLSSAESDLAARVLRFLVTPSGAKIAQQAAALSAWSDVEDTQAMEQVLNKLASAEMRILRRVEIAGQPIRFELFHDVLGMGVLDWRRRFVEKQSRERIRREEEERRQQEEARIRHEEEERRQREADVLAQQQQEERARRLRRVLVGLAVGVVIIASLAGFAAWAAVVAWRESGNANLQEEIATQQQRLAEERLKRIVAGMALKRAVLSGTSGALPEGVTRAPIDFGTRAVPYGYKNQAGQPVYRFELFPVAESVPGGLQTIAFITYKMDHPTFHNSLLFTGPSQDPHRNFVASYDGWGCLRQVIAVVEYTDPDKPPQAAAFDMCEILGW